LSYHRELGRNPILGLEKGCGPFVRNLETSARLDEIGAHMPEDASQLTCDEFQSRLCELLASDEPIEEHPHYKSCMICRCLVRNFEEMIENTLGKRTTSDNWPEST
jgi:hypothetical protein